MEVESSSSGSSRKGNVTAAAAAAATSLKIDQTGLSREWKAVKSHAPFFRGERSEISVDEKLLVCIDEENIVFVEWKSGEVIGRLLDPEDENRERITCFTLIPRRYELILSTKQGLLRHVDFSGLVDQGSGGGDDVGSNEYDMAKEGNHTKQAATVSKEQRAMAITVRVWKGHQMPVLSMSCDPSGTLVATGSADRSVKVWDIQGGFCTHNFGGHKEIVSLVRFHLDPYRLLLFSLSLDKSCKIFDLNDQTCSASFSNHVSPPTDFALSDDGYLMATAGRDKVLNFYELRNNVHIKTIPVMDELSSVILLSKQDSASILNSSSSGARRKDETSSISAPSVHVLVTAGQKGLLRLFRMEMNGKDISSFSCTPLSHIGPYDDFLEKSNSNHELNAITTMHYLPLYHHIVAMTADYNIMTYRLNKRHKKQDDDLSGSRDLLLYRHLIGCNDDILDMAILNSPRAIDDGEDGDENNTRVVEEGSENDGGGTQQNVTYAVVTNSAQVRLMDSTNFACVSLNGHHDTVLAIDASPDGKWIITSSKDKSIRIWNAHTCMCVGIGTEHTEAIGSVCCSQRSSTYQAKIAFIVSGGGDKVLKRWALATDKFMGNIEFPVALESTHSIRAHDKDVNTVTASPNDALIASGSQDKTIRLWNSADLSLIAVLKGHKRGVWRVCFSPVDKCIASCSGDRTVKLWSVSDYICLRTFEGHSCSVLSLQFVKNGMQIVSGSADGIIKLWTIRSGECDWTSDAHDEKIWSLKTISSTGQFISGGCDGKLKVWTDITAKVEHERLQSEENKLLVEQMMSNDIKAKRYGKALHAALELGIANKALGILLCVLEDENYEQRDEGHDEDILEMKSLAHRLDEYTRTFSDKEIATLMVFLQEWNTNSRHCFVSQALLSSLMNTVQIDRLRTIEEANNSLKGLEVYSDRHFQRIDRLHQAAYVLEYIAGLMNTAISETILEETADSGKDADDDDTSKYKFNAGKRRLFMRGKKEVVREDGEETLKIFYRKRGLIADDADDDDDDDDDDDKRTMAVAKESRKKSKLAKSEDISASLFEKELSKRTGTDSGKQLGKSSSTNSSASSTLKKKSTASTFASRPHRATAAKVKSKAKR